MLEVGSHPNVGIHGWVQRLGFQGWVSRLGLKGGSNISVLRFGPEADSDDLASILGPKARSQGWVLMLHRYAWS